MSEKKYSPEDVAKILRACNTPGSDCRDCPADHCSEFNSSLLAADVIEELLAKLEAQRWIPVGERLPDLDDGAVLLDGELTAVEVLVAIEGAKRSTELYFDGEEFFDYTGDELIPYRVTHWRPMPEVPGEEG